MLQKNIADIKIDNSRSLSNELNDIKRLENIAEKFSSWLDAFDPQEKTPAEYQALFQELGFQVQKIPVNSEQALYMALDHVIKNILGVSMVNIYQRRVVPVKLGSRNETISLINYLDHGGEKYPNSHVDSY